MANLFHKAAFFGLVYKYRSLFLRYWLQLALGVLALAVTNLLGLAIPLQIKQAVEPEPKCPACSVVGTEHIVSRKGGAASSRGKQFVLAPFSVIFCKSCGHVYGVTATS